jgi:hypothetical protein
MLRQALAQLDAIEQLSPGWDSHGGDPPDQQIVHSARHLLLSLSILGDQLAKPHVHPTPSGGVQLHWESGPRYFEIELVDPREARFYFVDRAAQTEAEGDLQVGDSLGRVVELARSVLL